MRINLLWADDDSEILLEPLGRILERQGFILTKAKNYTDAIRLLEEGRVDSLLADIILPYADGIGTLNSALGLNLAEAASSRGVRAVTFLTIVPLSDVLDKYTQLKEMYPRVQFQYLDKALLLELNTLEQLSESLSPRETNDAP